jgi:plastocyanin
VGDTVRFENADTVTHNITVKGSSEDDDAEDLGLQKPGAAVAHKFTARGSYRVICSIHPRMKMTVNVQ